MTKATPSKYRVMKFDGDDSQSNAVFLKEDVKGMRSPIIWGQATPKVSGCTRAEANGYKDQWDKRDNAPVCTITVAQQKQVFNAAERVWEQIAMDIPEDTVSKYAMLETSVDADRLTTFGHAEEHVLFQTMITEMGYEETMKALLVHAPYAHYEAGGACEEY